MPEGRTKTKPTKLPGAVVFDVGNVLLSWDPHAILREHLPAGADHGLEQPLAPERALDR
jgi:hypothetical protein